MAGVGPEAHAPQPPAEVLDTPEGGFGWPVDPQGASERYLAYLASNDLKAHGESLASIVHRAGGLTAGGILEVGGGVRVIGPVVQVVDEGAPAVPAIPGQGPEGGPAAPPTPVETPNWDQERERIRQEERQALQDGFNQLLEQQRAQFEQILNERVQEAVNQATEPLTHRVNELEAQLEQEREQHQQELAARDTEIEQLRARIAELEGGPPPPPPPPGANEILTPEQLQELQTDVEQARTDLIDITIRRKSRTWFDRLLRWRHGNEQEEYEQALARYTGLMERFQGHERATRIANGENEANIIEEQENDTFGELNDLAQEVYNENRDRVRHIIEHGNFFQRNWARATWFWGNRPWWQKGLAILGVGAGVAVVSATAGLGLAFIGAGAATKFSVSYFSNRSGVRNLAQHNLESEQARIQRAHQELINRRGAMSLDERRAQLPTGFGQVHEANIRRDRLWNTIGKTAVLGGGVFAILGAVGVDFLPSIKSAFSSGHNNDAGTARPGGTPNHPGGGGGQPNQPGGGSHPGGGQPGGGGTAPEGGPGSSTSQIDDWWRGDRSGNPPSGPGGGTHPGGGGTPGTQPGGGNGEIPGVGPGKATAEQLANSHVEPFPDGHGGTYDTTLVRLTNGDHLIDHGVGHISLVDAQNRVLVENVHVTSTGALSNSSILQSGLQHGPNQYFDMHTQYDKLHNPLHWSQRTVSSLLEDSSQNSNS